MLTAADLAADSPDSAEKVSVVQEEEDNQQTESQQELCCSKVLISSPTSPPGSCSALLSLKQGNGSQSSHQQLLRDLRLEQLR